MKHFVYKETRNCIKVKQNFFIVWKLHRLTTILQQLNVAQCRELNNCGWKFKINDHYYFLYKSYLHIQLVNCLIKYFRDKLLIIDKENKKLNKEDLHYLINLSIEISSAIDEAVKYSCLISSGEKDMIKQMKLSYLKKLINLR